MLKVNRNVVAVKIGRGSQYDDFAGKLADLTREGVEDGCILTAENLKQIGITEGTFNSVKNLLQGTSRTYNKSQSKIKASQCKALDKTSNKVYKSIRLVNAGSK